MNEHRIDVCHALRRAEVPWSVWGWAQQRALGEPSMVIPLRWGAGDLVQLCQCPQGRDVCPFHGRLQHSSCWESQSVQIVALWKEVSLERGSQGCNVWYSVCIGGAEKSEKLILSSKSIPHFRDIRVAVNVWDLQHLNLCWKGSPELSSPIQSSREVQLQKVQPSSEYVQGRWSHTLSASLFQWLSTFRVKYFS